MAFRFYSIFASFFLFLQGFSQTNPNYAFQINSHDEFNRLSGQPLTHAFAGVSSVKLVYNLDEQRLYFIQSKKFPLHFNFCRAEFEDGLELADFNNLNYSNNSGRKYILATLNYFRDLHLFTLEFSPADNISQASVERMYETVKANFFDASQFYVQLTTQSLLAYSNWVMPVISAKELFAGQKLQVIQQGETIGKLQFVEADSLFALGNVSDCILVLHGNSNDIPLCRGIITTSFQTPLSHISILSQNRKTPLIAVKDAWISAYLNSLKDSMVKFQVSSDSFLLGKTHLRELLESNKMNSIAFEIDSILSELCSLKKVKLKETAAFGVKATHLAELMRVKYKGKPIVTPEGAFAIPMKYYFQHIKKYGIDRLIHQLNTSNELLSPQEIRTLLKVIADSIEQSPFDASLAALIEKMIIQNNAGKRYRFRSSSNAEDLEGFNGAGLYTSETGIVGSKSKSIEIAIKKVWASLWNSRAYEERALAGINQETVGMAILAHRSFPEEYANGVAITRNLYRDFDFGFVINIQKGDNSLVKPADSASCEQFISYYNTADPFFNNKQAVEYLSLSSLNNNIPLLTREEIFDLTQKLDRIKNSFYRKLKKWKTMQYKDFAMDVEFKFDEVGSEKRLYFKQARPFN